MRLFALCTTLLFYAAASAQNIGIGITTPLENLHVDSAVKVGRNLALPNTLRKNLIKFGDGNYVTVGEEATDDRMYLRYGDLILQKSAGSIGNGFVGINTETPSATLDVNGNFRLRGNGAAAGRVLTADANGNAAWTDLPASGLTLPFDGMASAASNPLFIVRNLGASGGAGLFVNNSTSNTGYALQATSFNGNGGGGFYATGNAGTSTVTYGVRGSLSGTGTAGFGVHGSATNADGVGGESQTGNGVQGIARASGGTGGYFAGFTGAGALKTYGSVQLTGIGEGAGKVLTSDASGGATWQTPVAPPANVGFRARLANNLALNFGGTMTDFESLFDDGNHFDEATGVFTVPAAGVNEFKSTVLWSSSSLPANAEVAVTLRLRRIRGGIDNVIDQVNFNEVAVGGYGLGAHLSSLQKLTAGDKLYMEAQNSYGGMTLLGGSSGGSSSFSGVRIY